ncbi:MAG: hypothetical protein Q7T56_14750 [Nocardioidaceae bacterium]|nr:hypothetical protein [Nocardioidaceae bacterium]
MEWLSALVAALAALGGVVLANRQNERRLSMDQRNRQQDLALEACRQAMKNVDALHRRVRLGSNKRIGDDGKGWQLIFAVDGDRSMLAVSVPALVVNAHATYATTAALYNLTGEISEKSYDDVYDAFKEAVRSAVGLDSLKGHE